MNHTELFRTYLHHHVNKNLEAISAMLAEEVHLRDWTWLQGNCLSPLIWVFGMSDGILWLHFPVPTHKFARRE